jgi:hypothetical protein
MRDWAQCTGRGRCRVVPSVNSVQRMFLAWASSPARVFKAMFPLRQPFRPSFRLADNPRTTLHEVYLPLIRRGT